ncbi:hypothetical protein [Massilia soli]|uniref:Uncharacterized protein n=1 Tax=Massilia soli TaxID=2792854 RepID=A0ABS7SKA8_9BURK|nr:hypothetical protein [Massilia soli]MBZ2206636.1 hypothetical protein [Massilia soli]
MYLNRCIAAGLTAAALALPATSLAGQPDNCYRGNGALPRAPATKAQPADAFGPAARAATLDDTRGGDGGTASDTKLSGTVSGNTATNVATGANIIQSGSFANASGVPIVIQNTGANVLIQNATVINLQLK